MKHTWAVVNMGDGKVWMRCNLCPIQVGPKYPHQCSQHSFVPIYQGDQIGRIITHWASVYFRQTCENYISVHILGYFYPRLISSINFDKKWLGLHFGRFFHEQIWSPCYLHVCIQYFHYYESCWTKNSFFDPSAGFVCIQKGNLNFCQIVIE
jgi:hypothetical protein